MRWEHPTVLGHGPLSKREEANICYCIFYIYIRKFNAFYSAKPPGIGFLKERLQEKFQKKNRRKDSRKNSRKNSEKNSRKTNGNLWEKFQDILLEKLL